MKLYCGFKLDHMTECMVKAAMTLANPIAPLTLVPEDRLHITTAFLGELDEVTASDILKAAAGVSTFSCKLGAPSSFPSVLYLSVVCTSARMVRDRQAERYKQLTGRTLWPKEYVPHLTIAKSDFKADRNLLAPLINDAKSKIDDFDSGEFLVDTLYLFHKSEVIDSVKLQPVLF